MSFACGDVFWQEPWRQHVIDARGHGELLMYVYPEQQLDGVAAIELLSFGWSVL